MKKLFLSLSFCLLPLTLYGAATERGFTIEYMEPSLTACGGSTQLKPTSAPTMCLEALGSEAQQNTCNSTKNQRFEMITAGTGLFQLKSQMTNLCLRIGANDGDAIIETSCANAASGGGAAQDQIFRIGPSPSQIQSNTGAGGLCLDVGGASQAAGHKIQSYTCHGGSNQLFAYNLSAGGDCPLDDLAGTKIYMDVVGDGVGGTVDTVDATAKTGGGKISKKYCVPILDDATALTIEIEVTAFDESGNESERTPKLIHPVPGTRDCTPPDNTPPAGVENLSIQ
jgi:hypothetical protein